MNKRPQRQLALGCGAAQHRAAALEHPNRASSVATLGLGCAQRIKLPVELTGCEGFTDHPDAALVLAVATGTPADTGVSANWRRGPGSYAGCVGGSVGDVVFNRLYRTTYKSKTRRSRHLCRT